MAGSIMLDSKPTRCKTHGNADLLTHSEEDQILILGDHVVFVLEEGPGAMVWEYCTGNTTIRDMIKLLLSEYDVEESLATEEVTSFIQKLLERKLITI